MINPSGDRPALTLAMNEAETACEIFDLSSALEASQDYGLNQNEAANVLKQRKRRLQAAREEATRLNIPRARQDLMAKAFQGDNWKSLCCAPRHGLGFRFSFSLFLPPTRRAVALRGWWADIPQPSDEYALHAGLPYRAPSHT